MIFAVAFFTRDAGAGADVTARGNGADAAGVGATLRGVGETGRGAVTTGVGAAVAAFIAASEFGEMEIFAAAGDGAGTGCALVLVNAGCERYAGTGAGAAAGGRAMLTPSPFAANTDATSDGTSTLRWFLRTKYSFGTCCNTSASGSDTDTSSCGVSAPKNSVELAISSVPVRTI